MHQSLCKISLQGALWNIKLLNLNFATRLPAFKFSNLNKSIALWNVSIKCFVTREIVKLKFYSAVVINISTRRKFWRFDFRWKRGTKTIERSFASVVEVFTMFISEGTTTLRRRPVLQDCSICFREKQIDRWGTRSCRRKLTGFSSTFMHWNVFGRGVPSN